MAEKLIFQFAGFTLHAARRELVRDGVLVELGSRAMDVLLALVRRYGQVATKADIMAEVWPGVVEENNLTTQIATVRRALGETPENRFILTVPGRGYRFVAEVVDDQAALTAAPPLPAPKERHNLPIETSSFIGRGAEMEELRLRLRTRALVSVVGPGGVGKTRAVMRLAQNLVADFPDGVMLLELAPLTESRLVAEAACRLLGVPASGERAAEELAASVLRGKILLLVLDNCEHVLPGAASFAGAILRTCPGVKILATSQEALCLPGESVFPMPALPLPAAEAGLSAAAALESDAVRLFVDRAADALGGYVLTDAEAPAVASICRRLDGVPLATELAAARLRMLTPAEIAARLEDVFRLLTGGSRVALPRHQTLRATIDWSFSLLLVAEQVALRRLSVFVDGCSLDGAVAVVGGGGIEPDAVFDLVASLVSKSLVVADKAGTATRYRMLETTRQYAAEKLRHAGETAFAGRMARYVLEVFRRANADWPVQPTAPWLAAYAPERENLRAAIDWAFGPSGAPALGVALVANVGALVEEMSLHADLRRWIQAACPHVNSATPPIEAASLAYLGTVLQKRLGVHEVPGERADAIALCRAAGDAVGLSRALRQTAIARAMPGRGEQEGMAMLAEAVALLQHLAPHKDLATALAHTGSIHFQNGRLDEARHFNELALAMRETLGDSTGVLASSVNLAELLFLAGDTAGALRYATQAAAAARRRNLLATLALILTNLAGYQLRSGQTDAARQTAHEALRLNRATGQDYFAVICLEHLALVLALGGALDRAAGLCGYCSFYYAAMEQVREPLEQMGYDQLQACLGAGLSPAYLAELLAAGGMWSADVADQVALRG